MILHTIDFIIFILNVEFPQANEKQNRHTQTKLADQFETGAELSS